MHNHGDVLGYNECPVAVSGGEPEAVMVRHSGDLESFLLGRCTAFGHPWILVADYHEASYEMARRFLEWESSREMEVNAER